MLTDTSWPHPQCTTWFTCDANSILSQRVRVPGLCIKRPWQCLGAVGIGGGFGPLFWITNHGNKRHSAGLWPIQKILEVLESREVARSNKGIKWEIDYAFWKVTGTYASPCILQSVRGDGQKSRSATKFLTTRGVRLLTHRTTSLLITSTLFRTLCESRGDRLPHTPHQAVPVSIIAKTKISAISRTGIEPVTDGFHLYYYSPPLYQLSYREWIFLVEKYMFININAQAL